MRPPRGRSLARAPLWFTLIGCLAFAAASRAGAQDTGAPTRPDRERWALVGIWTPGLQRVGLLVPLSPHLMLRPDIRGYASETEGQGESWYVNPGISLIVRTRPTDGGWLYTSLRAAFSLDDYQDWMDAYTLTVGGHARLVPGLSVFGETGVGYIYDEDPPDTYIYRTYDFVARFGFALSRPPRR